MDEATSKKYRDLSCDRCKEAFGLYQYEVGKWRCPHCIWIELQTLKQKMTRLNLQIQETIGD